MAFEDLLEDAGGFGLYQKLLCFVFLVLAVVNSGVSYWTQIFIMLVPKKHCDISNSTFLEFMNQTELDKCPEKVGNATLGCTTGWVYDYDEFIPTVSSELNWVCEEYWKPYSIHTIFWVGSVCGFFITGIISDRYGRWFTMFMLEAVMIISNIMSIFMTTHIQFAVVRFLTGMSVLTSSTLAFLMTIEYTGVKQRTFIGLMQGVGWSFMAGIAPWIAYIIRDWRWLLGLCVLPSIVVLIVLIWVPESASWLLTRGKRDKALHILQHIAKVNGRKLPENHFRKEMERQNLGNVEKPSSKEIFQSIVQVVKTPNLRKNISLLLMMWFIVSMCYNGIMIQIGNLPTNHYIAYSIGAVIELVANIYFGIAAENLGRRWANFAANIFGAAIAMSIIFVPKGVGILELVLTLTGRLAWAASYDVTLQYSAELLPTVIRGRGLSLQLMIGDLGNTVAPFVVYLDKYNSHYPMLVFGFISILSAFLSMTLPETSTELLPQTIEDGATFGINQSFWWTCPLWIKRNNRKKKKKKANAPSLPPIQEIMNGKHMNGKDEIYSIKPSKDVNYQTNLAFVQYIGENEASKL